MAQLPSTIWALILNRLGISVFRTCFAYAFEDEYGIPFVLSPPFTSSLIATSVYIIVVSSTLFPQAFRKPPLVFLYLYEVSVSIKKKSICSHFLAFFVSLIAVSSNGVLFGICDRLFVDADRRAHVKRMARKH